MGSKNQKFEPSPEELEYIIESILNKFIRSYFGYSGTDFSLQD